MQSGFVSKSLNTCIDVNERFASLFVPHKMQPTISVGPV